MFVTTKQESLLDILIDILTPPFPTADFKVALRYLVTSTFIQTDLFFSLLPIQKS